MYRLEAQLDEVHGQSWQILYTGLVGWFKSLYQLDHCRRVPGVQFLLRGFGVRFTSALAMELEVRLRSEAPPISNEPNKDMECCAVVVQVTSTNQRNNSTHQSGELPMVGSSFFCGGWSRRVLMICPRMPILVLRLVESTVYKYRGIHVSILHKYFVYRAVRSRGRKLGKRLSQRVYRGFKGSSEPEQSHHPDALSLNEMVSDATPNPVE